MRLVQLLMAFLILSSGNAHGQSVGKLEGRIAEIQAGLEAIRGDEFLHPVKVASQSQQGFSDYLDMMIESHIAPNLLDNYGKIVRKLGLYRGPEIEDFKSLIKLVVQSQAAAYYDPEKDSFFIVMQELPEQVVNAVFAHELYHGYQDQHFDLRRFYLDRLSNGLNDDELLARQSVIEGEATYVSQLWTMKKMFGQIPDTTALQFAMQMQSQVGIGQLLQMVKNGAFAAAANSDVQEALNSIDRIPTFLLETMFGPYFKGMGFVYHIQREGWERVDELYSNPPVSMEQVLHPEKWLAGEQPVIISWPDFTSHALFQEWRLLESNTLGEFQWRIIFTEHDLESRAATAADGWNGDSFAVFQHESGQEMLLLLLTAWDTEEDAEEFEEAYRQLLAVKYPQGELPVRVKQVGKDVAIVEGGTAKNTQAFLNLVLGLERGKL